MKRQYKQFLGIFALLLVVGILISPFLEYYFFPQDMAHRRLQVQADTEPELEDQLLWFTFANDDLNLYCNSALRDCVTELSYLDIYGACHTTALDGFSFTNEMSGTYLAMSEPTVCDADGDGTEETVIVCAKADTNETQGYSEYSNQFGDLLDIPLEIVKNGRTGLMIYRNGTAYTGEITLHTTGIESRTMEIQDGCVEFVDARELWDGIVVTIREGEFLYVGTYVPEAHTIFTMQHLEACVPFFVLIAATALGITTVCWIRRRYRVRWEAALYQTDNL